MIKKYTTIFLLSLTSLTAFAQSSNFKSDIKVNAVAKSGCFISMQNIAFGDITTSNAVRIPSPIDIQCSKGTNVALTAISKVNPEGFRGFYMTIGEKEILPKGNIEKDLKEGIQYYILVNNVVSVENEVSVMYKGDGNVLGSLLLTNYDYTLRLKMLSGKKVSIPTEGFVTASNRSVLIPGAYSDHLTITLTY